MRIGHESAIAPLRWSSGGATDHGRIRSLNQDAFLDRPDIGLWAVADGMGGHADGGMASDMLVDRLGTLKRPRFLGMAVAAIGDILAQVNDRLVTAAAARGDDLSGSTIVTLAAVGDHCAIVWVGDSRAYRLRDGELVQLTTDHTYVQAMVTSGLLTPEEAESHPMSNVLLCAVGSDSHLQADRRIDALRDRDRYLLCSDGLFKEIAPDLIAADLGLSEPTSAAQALIKRACAAGGRDNVTAVVIDFFNATAHG